MERPIGVFDSGVGGLTVAHELMRQLPNEELIYVGDTLRCPYGSRPKHEVKQFTNELVQFLLDKNVKVIVIACNTATAFTLNELKSKLDIPIIGVIQPGARAAIKNTMNQRIGIIGTEGTVTSQAYPKALQQINQQLEVTSLACPLFVPMVEKGITEGEQAKVVVQETLKPLRNTKDIDTLVLGCTHYPLLEDVIQDVMGDEVKIISSGEETARETSTILEIENLLYKGERTPKHSFYTTGDLEVFQKISNSIFKKTIHDLQNLTIEKVIL
ncbi:MAG TPA: glutamate racemase [Pseudogracilibacillus sp.]|nr:glutamate racemase [Pseudogracilibacillus sp.]